MPLGYTAASQGSHSPKRGRRRFALGWRPLCLGVLWLGLSPQLGFAAQPPPDYNRDIRPILSDNCFHCHGPDAGNRKGKLRLDQRQAALDREAFVPGKPKDSELIRRIDSADPDEVMPKPESNKTLTRAQKELLHRWIADGAQYEGHWAYEKPVRPAMPAAANPIDWLVAKRLQTIGLSPAPEADRRTLARRLHFDLDGTPPTPEEVEAFARDKSVTAYDALVEKLLASPHFGERMALGWLDVVRYADTIGYHSDNPRNVWPYRDYVIKAFNENKPFDVFTREQLAGDLLPQSGLEQKVGSAFNRLLLTTEEGGAQPKDYEARMLTDRVRAVGAVWLGQTIGCAQCHDHKFDPITSRDFYSLGAFFADLKEPIVGKREDGCLVPNNSQAAELAKRDAEVQRWEEAYNATHAELRERYAAWKEEQLARAGRENLWSPLKPSEAQAASGDELHVQPDASILVSGTNKPNTDTYTLLVNELPSHLTGLRLEVSPDDSLPAHGPGRAERGNFALSKLTANIKHANGELEPIAFAAARVGWAQAADGGEISNQVASVNSVIDTPSAGEVAGWVVAPQATNRQQLTLVCDHAVDLGANEALKIELLQNHGQAGDTLGHFRILVATNAAMVAGLVADPATSEAATGAGGPVDGIKVARKDMLWEEFKTITPELATLRTNLAAARGARAEYAASLPHCLISETNAKPRTVRILPRGNFLLETGDIVHPAFPGYLKASWQGREKPRLTRLDLANWLVSPENPLTARVVMNRLWRQFFGAGLARPLDDFGAQGEYPKNPELLDWLACEFMDSGWDMKHMVRLLVKSEAYRRTSKLSRNALAADPYNREFSAQGRWRLDAELVRDNALAISDLLVDKVGGPSVKPYQPAGYWENLNFPTREWEAGAGEDLYRRGLYTWWQRSYLQPSLLAFDAPTREECCAERNRSNIPQQALALLNDPTYVEAARVFAAHILANGGAATKGRLDWAWRRALDRPPRTDEIKTATALLTKQLAEYRKDLQSADALLHIGATPPPGGDPAELAAWTNVARLILNLHETITRN